MELNEHLEKDKDQPWEYWAHRLCRECNHELYLHILESDDEGAIVGACNYLIKRTGFCGCVEFQSPDNLDYIELLAKRKGIISDDEKGIEQ